MRVLCIDYGDVRIGLALSDELGITAQGLGTIINRGEKKLLDEMSKIISDNKITKIVLGMPKNMDGSIGGRGEITLAFADSLKTIFDGEIDFFDERLSTVSAINVLNSTNTRGKKRKAVLDTVAAAIILQAYLDSKLK